MDYLKRIYKIGSEFLLSLIITTAAMVLEFLLPVHLIDVSAIALFPGILLDYLWGPVPVAQAGVRFTSKRILRLAIMLLGASLSIQTTLHVGRYSPVVMRFTLFTCLGGGYSVGKVLELNWKLSNLISAGAGICGGSAIAVTAPAVNAKDRDIAYAMSATFLFDMATILSFPIMGRAMGLSDMAYGLRSGTAVNDTSSVVMAGYAFSEAAGDFATMVKLARTLSTIPTVVIFVLIEVRLKHKEAAATGLGGDIRASIKFSSLFPWLILGFLALVFMNNLGFISPPPSLVLKEMSKFLMVTFSGAIGLDTSFREICQSGTVPMLHGFITSALVVIMAIGAKYFMGTI